ncbi:Leucine-rich repeat [Sergentomyia squamirostris]
MDYKLPLGLIVLLGILSIRLGTVKADIADEEEDDYDEDYNDEEYPDAPENQTDKAPERWSERLNVTKLVEQAKEVFNERVAQTVGGEYPTDDDEVEEEDEPSGRIPAQECPLECSCLPDSFVDCSRRNLTKIPINLPKNTTFLDLSHNFITTIHLDDFGNVTQLREIRLRSNEIESIDKMAFAHLDRLDTLDLSDNHLKHIDPDTLAHSLDVKKVNLSGNPLEIPTDGSLLNAPSLEELDLSGCNISELFVDTFVNLTGLVALNINNNPINEGLSVNVFQPLGNLQHFQSVTLSQENIPELCDNLKAIDEIRFPDFILSCFELASGSTFEESIATHPPSTISPPPTTTTPVVSTTSTSTTTKTTTSTTPLPENQPKLGTMNTELKNLPEGNLTMSGNDTTEASVVTTPAIGPEVVQMSAETINNILIGIIIIAVVGLAIGVICRRDCCGIKTKMCRTRTRRPAPTDQVRPAEEVPLNKIG